MKIRVNIKGFSKKGIAQENKITSIEYEYPDDSMNVREFLEHTVKITVKNYQEQVAGGMKDKFKEFGQLGIWMNEKQSKINIDEAVKCVLQNYEDGLVAVFVDGIQYENCLDEKVPLRDGSEVTFIRLTFLVGRMW